MQKFKAPPQLRIARMKSGATETLKMEIIQGLSALNTLPRTRLAEIIRAIDPSGRLTLNDLNCGGAPVRKLVERLSDLWANYARLCSPFSDLRDQGPRQCLQTITKTVVPLCQKHLILTKIHNASWFAPSQTTWEALLDYFEDKPLPINPPPQFKDDSIFTNDQPTLWLYSKGTLWVDSIWDRLSVEIQVLRQGMNHDFRNFDFVASKDLGDSLLLTSNQNQITVSPRWEKAILFDPMFLPKDVDQAQIYCSQNVICHGSYRDLRRSLITRSMEKIKVHSTEEHDETASSEVTVTSSTEALAPLFEFKNKCFRPQVAAESWGSVSWTHVVQDSTSLLLGRLKLPNLGSMLIFSEDENAFSMEIPEGKFPVMSAGPLRESLYYVEAYLNSDEALKFRKFLGHQYACTWKETLRILPYPILNYEHEIDYTVINQLRPFIHNASYMKAASMELLKKKMESTLHEIIILIHQARRHNFKSLKKLSEATYPANWLSVDETGLVVPNDPEHFKDFEDSLTSSRQEVQGNIDKVTKTLNGIFDLILAVRSSTIEK